MFPIFDVSKNVRSHHLGSIVCRVSCVVEFTLHITCVFEYMRYTGCTYKLYLFIYSISSLCVSREMVYLQILSLHLPMDYVFWYCFLFMRFSDLKNKQALFEKDERLIFKRFEKICLLSKQISMKTSLWDFSSL